MFPKILGQTLPDYDGGARAAIRILSISNRYGRREEKETLSSSQKSAISTCKCFMDGALGVVP